MNTDTGTEAAIAAKKAFYAFISTLPDAIRDEVECAAYENSWTVETYDASITNEARWAEAKACAEMIADAPADFGIMPT